MLRFDIRELVSWSCYKLLNLVSNATFMHEGFVFHESQIERLIYRPNVAVRTNNGGAHMKLRLPRTYSILFLSVQKT